MTEFHVAESNAIFIIVIPIILIYFMFQRIHHRIKNSQSRGIAFLKESYSYDLQQELLDFAARTQAHAYWCGI